MTRWRPIFQVSHDSQTTLNQKPGMLLLVTRIQIFIPKHFIQRRLKQEISYSRLLQPLINQQRNCLQEESWGKMTDFITAIRRNTSRNKVLVRKAISKDHSLKSHKLDQWILSLGRLGKLMGRFRILRGLSGRGIWSIRRGLEAILQRNRVFTPN